MTLRNEAWLGEQVKAQKNDLKLFLHAGHAEIMPSTCWKLSFSVTTWSLAQQTGPSAKSAPQTSINRARVASSG